MICTEEILKFLSKNGEPVQWKGNLNISIQGFCSISNLKKNTITWVKTADKLNLISNEILEDLLIVGKMEDEDRYPEFGNYIFCHDPKKIFFSILQHFFASEEKQKIENDSVILTEKIGNNVSIGHFCFIGKDVEIGNEVIIGNHVTIECQAKIGDRSIIHSGTVIGTDGFGYFKDKDEFRKVPHFGGVIIGRNVEIGANTCIDRGTLDDTCIGNGVKIDNLCHIAHNVKIGKNSLIIACSLLGGSSCVEENGYVAPGAIIKNQILVGSNSVIGMGAVVTRNIESGKIAAGVPAKIIRDNDGIL